MSERLRFKCRSCGIKTGPAVFEDVDLAFNQARPLCPGCQDEADLEGKTCEFCEEPAGFSTASGPLCRNHFERYVDGYRPRD